MQYFWSSPESKTADVLAAQAREALLGKFLQVVGSLIIDHRSQNEALRHVIHILCKATTLILTAVSVKPEDVKVKFPFWHWKKQIGTSSTIFKFRSEHLTRFHYFTVQMFNYSSVIWWMSWLANKGNVAFLIHDRTLQDNRNYDGLMKMFN